MGLKNMQMHLLTPRGPRYKPDTWQEPTSSRNPPSLILVAWNHRELRTKAATMEATISYQSTIRFLYPISSSPPTQAHQICPKQRIPGNGQLVSRMRCAKGGSVPELDKKLEEEMSGMKILSENCKEIGGVVELVECLEREAIMGEDKGREASDYHRRAHIFDQSSRVFQALKERRSSFD